MSAGFQNSTLNQSQVRPERPVGVSLLTIINGFYAGLLPVSGAISSIMNAPLESQEGISLLLLCMTVGLPVGIVTTAIGTFKGHDRARFWLLILIAVYFSLTAFQDVSFVAAGAYSDEVVYRALGRALRSGVWVAANAWYFLRPSTIAFFRRQRHK